MTDPEIPDDSPLPDAPGDGQPGDDLTDLPNDPPTQATDSPEPPDDGDAARPEPCTANGGASA